MYQFCCMTVTPNIVCSLDYTLYCFFLIKYFFTQTIFFVELNATESRKLVERLVNYVIYKVCSSILFYLRL